MDNLKRRKSPSPSSREPAGYHVNDVDFRVHCADEGYDHGHPPKTRSSAAIAIRILGLITLAAAVVLIGKDHLDRHSESSSFQQQQPSKPLRPVPQTVEFVPPVDSKGPKAEITKPHAPKPQLKKSHAKKSSPPPPKFGKMNHGMYRFKAKKLGRAFEKAVEFFDEWIGSEVDPVGAAFAKQRVAMPGVAEYHQDCYNAPDVEKMLFLEQRKKEHSIHDQTRLEFLAEEQALFYNYTHQLKQEELVHITANSQWAWRTSALFSAQYSGTQSEFRKQINGILQDDKHLGGKVSGTFWYPPNAIREWHTNAWDVSVDKETGKMKKPWRMYFVRQKPVEEGGEVKDKSGFHLVDGNGITSDRLVDAGAYQLTHHDDGTPNVWRVPDRNGYVTLFRLQVTEPYRWHCIVADESVHRYSLGLSLSDDDVEALLEHIGVDL